MPTGPVSDIALNKLQRVSTLSLRFQLAQDGCAESQLSIARSLLNESNNNDVEERYACACVAVHWLVQASQKGHPEAVKLLKDCYRTGIGISAHNRFAVEKCLALNELELLACRVGHSLFSIIAMSDSEDTVPEDVFQEKAHSIIDEGITEVFETNSSGLDAGPEQHDLLTADRSPMMIPSNRRNLLDDDDEPSMIEPPKTAPLWRNSEQMQKSSPAPQKSREIRKAVSPRMFSKASQKVTPAQLVGEAIQEDSSSVKDTKESLPPEEGKPSVSVDDVVTSVQQCLEGNLPLITLKRVVQFEEYNKWFSLKYARFLTEKLRHGTEVFIEDLSSAALPVTVLVCALLLWIFMVLVSVGNEMNAVMAKYKLIFGSVLSLSIMISCSCYMIYLNYGSVNVEKWLTLVKIFEPSIRTEESEEKYYRNAKYPTLIFFACSLVFVTLQPFSPVGLISSEIAMFVILLIVLLDRSITSQRGYVTISLFLNILICMQKEKLIQLSLPDWMKFLDFDISYSIYGRYEINLSWWSVISLPLMLLIMYFKMSRCCGSGGVYAALLPHLMCLTWLNISFNLYGAYSASLLLSASFWFAVLLLSSYIGAVPALAMTLPFKMLTTLDFSNYPMILGSIAVLTLSYTLSKFIIRKFQNIFRNISSRLLLVVVIASFVLFLVPISARGPVETSSTVIPWSKYETYCHRNAWYRSNPAEVEVACLPLKGHQITLDGTVSSVSISKVKNRVASILSFLPSPISNILMCALGDRVCGNVDTMPKFEKERCAFFESLDVMRCTVDGWNVYEYSIVLEVFSRTSPEAIIKASHLYAPFINSLKEGDTVQIKGVLEGVLESKYPEISLQEATCTSCADNTKYTSSVVSVNFNYDFPMQRLIKFYLFPFIQYHK